LLQPAHENDKMGGAWMNPVLLFLIILALFMFWLLCSFLYEPIGKLFSRLINDVKNAMFETKEKE
jgi:hypothetical protein